MAAQLARTRPDLLLLTFHVTYWNYLGWRDPYSFDAATQRQRHYVALGVSSEVYTPALIVEGKLDAGDRIRGRLTTPSGGRRRAKRRPRGLMFGEGRPG